MNAVQQKLMEIRARNAAQQQITQPSQPQQEQTMNPVRAKLLEIRARNTAQAGQPVSQPTGALAPVMNQQKQAVLPPAQPTQQNKPGLLRRAAGAVGDVAVGFGKGVLDVPREFASLGADLGTKFGETNIGRKLGAGIRSTLGGTINPETARTLQAGLQGGTEQTNFTKPQNTAQKVGFGAEKIGEFFLPGGAAGKIGKVVTEAGTASKLPKIGKALGFTSKIIADAGINSGIQAAQDGKSDNIISDALLFGGLNVAGKGLSAVGKSLTTKLPERLYNTAIKTGLEDTRKALTFNGQSLGKDLIDRGIVGTDKQLLKKSITNIDAAEAKLQTILKEHPATISRDELFKHLNPLVEKFASTPGLAGDFDTLTKVLDQVPPSLSLSQANVMKRNLYSALRDVAFKLDPALSSKKEVMKTLAKGIKTEIENKTASLGKDVVKNLNQDLAVNGRLQDRIIDKLARAEKNNIFGLGDMAITGTGSAAGLAGAGLPGLALGGVALGGRKLLGSTVFKTNTAVALDRTGKGVKKLPVAKIGAGVRAGIVKSSR